MPSPTALPRIASALGLAGLLPQLAAVLAVLGGGLESRFVALGGGFAYAATILSFLGGMWWGLASSAPQRSPAWLWIAAVMPSLVAVAAAIPWMIGAAWPRPSLAILGVAILASLAVDRRIVALGLAPDGWMPLRIRLSAGLGGLTLLLAIS